MPTIPNLPAKTSAVASGDLVIVYDTAGGSVTRMTMANFMNTVPSAVNFSANVTVLGTTTANVTNFTGNVTVAGTKYLVTNNFVVTKNNSPASSTTGVVAGDLGIMWSDGSFIYVQANNTHYKRVAVATW